MFHNNIRTYSREPKPKPRHPTQTLEISSSSSGDEADITIEEPQEEELQCLQPGRMLNDTVVDKYMSLVWRKSPNRRKIHLFNTFLYKKLTRAKDDEPIRWDKNVDIFSKELLVIPVCEGSHWILVVVFHPGKSQDFKYGAEKPCVVVFDSLGFRYMRQFLKPIRRFLQQRWDTDRWHEGRRYFTDSDKLREYTATVPRQANSYDCGVHMLHNFERIIESPSRWIRMVDFGLPLTRSEFIIDGKEKRREIERELRK